MKMGSQDASLSCPALGPGH